MKIKLNIISIPHGTIKSECNGEIKQYNLISIPHGTIKSLKR